MHFQHNNKRATTNLYSTRTTHWIHNFQLRTQEIFISDMQGSLKVIQPNVSYMSHKPSYIVLTLSHEIKKKLK